jgi:diguanylate cyclase (GGDEF)-like protein/PAS domain S-box-containing protein
MSDVNVIRILYMEDDPALSFLLKKSLQRQGFVVDTAANGEEGISKVGSTQYDLLLVDYNMPFLGGLDVLRSLSWKATSPPTIMLTGEGNVAVAVEALKLGAADYIVKDVGMKYLELLPVVIDRALYKRQLTEERSQMEKVIHESEERYRNLVELSPDGIAIHADGVIVFMNPAGVRILGAASTDQLIGVSSLSIVHPDYHESFTTWIHNLEGRSERVPGIEQKYVRHDGTVIDVEVSGSCFINQGAPAIQMIFHDITERKQVVQQLERLALYDTLTGLPNRALFFDRMNQFLALARRNSYILALLYMDLDHFKDINDTHGHEVGDLLLVEAAGRMTSSIRSSDTIARMGGDEFVGICTRITAGGDAAIVASKIITTLSLPFHIKGFTLTIGVSLGISIYPLDGDNAESLVNKADAAMYRVKESEKGGYLFFSDLERSSVTGSGRSENRRISGHES